MAGLGSGAYLTFGDGDELTTVNVRVGISYVSAENARANLEAENPEGSSLEALREQAWESWNESLKRIEIGGGSEAERTVFYTALYHSLIHMNLFSDVNGEYRGFDGAVHQVAPPQEAQYANFSGWDVYRSQVQLVALLFPDVASDMAQSLLNQANQNGGVWDRWTHNTGATHVMSGDPSAPTVAGIVAFGGTRFDVEGAFDSLVQAATVPTALDLSDEGCRIMCPGQRPSLDQWLSLGYIAAQSNSWGGAGETLEDVSADYSLARLAERLGDEETRDLSLSDRSTGRTSSTPRRLRRAGTSRIATPTGAGRSSIPASSRGFAEGSSAQYTWMIPHDAQGPLRRHGGKRGGRSAAGRVLPQRRRKLGHHPHGEPEVRRLQRTLRGGTLDVPLRRAAGQNPGHGQGSGERPLDRPAPRNPRERRPGGHVVLVRLGHHGPISGSPRRGRTPGGKPSLPLMCRSIARMRTTSPSGLPMRRSPIPVRAAASG